jgi:hypothetical protein
MGRLLQGVGSGGQQAVEQSYLAVAAPPEQRTELTGKLSTFASLGFIFGPALGASVSQTPRVKLGLVRFTTFTKQGWLVAALNVVMILNTLAFTEVKAARTRASEPGSSGRDRPGKADSSCGAAADERSGGGAQHGVWACIFIFFVHFNGFAVQETITTPLVKDWFGWDEVAANLLFTAAGLVNLLCAVVMSYLSGTRVNSDGTQSQLVDDRTLLVGSLVLALVGWFLMVPPDEWGAAGLPRMGLVQFSAAFGLVTVAFPFGRGVCLAMVGKLLGDQPQGHWMGIMFSLGAIARIAGPFWAVTGYLLFGSFSVFGSTALLFGVSLAAMRLLWSDLAPRVSDSSALDPSPARHPPQSASGAVASSPLDKLTLRDIRSSPLVASSPPPALPPSPLTARFVLPPATATE